MSELMFLRTDPGREPIPADRLARGLGWLGLGLGLGKLLAPRAIARLAGVESGPGSSLALRAAGLFELTAGLSLLLGPRRATPLWARVAADAVNLGMLASAASSPRNRGLRLAAATIAIGGITALDVYAGSKLHASAPGPQPIISAVTINKPPLEVYRFFRKLTNLPLFMNYLDSVEETGATRSHWVARLPLAGTTAWDAEVTEDRPGEVLAWRSVGSTIAHRGRVSFSTGPAPGATEVHVEWELGLGSAGSATLAKLLTRAQVKGDLRRLKQVLETGEVLYSDASAHREPHPAQPSVDGMRRAAALAARSATAIPPGQRLSHGGVS